MYMIKIRWIPVSRTGMTPFFVLLHSKLQRSYSCVYDTWIQKIDLLYILWNIVFINHICK
ncbi:hypothetical protein [Wolbachia endosymbiont of Folsomia candida]|uniref:hypothetical protein n=1 Tax=Wolbachia endosymbiont of Folsomia candida TaxID=169402 RepID=UPI00130061A5|nr:hypothetical protein [Wolbachia endosymbiont of Folsomia candida]